MEIKNVTETVTEYLREQIICGQLKPGQKLNEQQLAETLRISRPPLRETFRKLEPERLVVNHPRKGTYVTELSIGDLRDVYQVREMIECYAIDLLKINKIGNFEKMEQAIAQCRNCSPVDANEVEGIKRCQKLFSMFHDALIAATENDRLLHSYKAISSSLNRYQFIFFFIPGTGSGDLSLKYHTEILDLIRSKDFTQAKKHMVEHIQYSYDYLKTAIMEIAEGEKGNPEAPKSREKVLGLTR